MKEAEQIWWEQTNAKNFIDCIIEKLRNEISVVVKSCSSIPWHSCFISNIETTIEKSVGTRTLLKIDSSNIDDIGKYFLQEFCKPELRNKYRPAKGYPAFLAENDNITLHDRFILVNSVKKEVLKPWLDFICEYVKKRGDKRKATFLLETDAEKTELRKSIFQASLEEFINDYDYVAFAILAASPLKEKPVLKTYLVELISNIVGRDAELSSECIEQYGDFLENPVKTIEKIKQNSFSDENPIQFCKTDEEMEKNIWTAQIRTFYPLLEEYRRYFIKKYRDEIEKQLPITTSFDETITVPEEVELGVLNFIAAKLNIGREEKNELFLFKEARNSLSHLNTLPFQKIKELAEKLEQLKKLL